MKKLRTPAILLAGLAIYFFMARQTAYGQYCDPTVPTFYVDLTGQPNGAWTSPFIQRQDHCCGAVNPDQCVQFVVTLDPNSNGLVFSVAAGALPPGALFYQVNCGPVTAVGQPLCLTGVGPHVITFCKPGNNTNQYQITALPFPSSSPDVVANEGCSQLLGVSGLDPSTVSWTSIGPGAPGTYNSYLDCTTGCDTVTVTPQPGFPPYIDYQVCGFVYGGCYPFQYCDTIRVTINPTLGVNITPLNPTICFGSAGVTVTANPAGGQPPYSYQWSTGTTTVSDFVGVGTYTVSLTDGSGCPATTASVTVTAFSDTIEANAGPDLTICSQSPAASLNGQVTGVSTGVWLNGGGTFTPGNTSLNPVYVPSAAEITAGFAELYLLTTNTGTCPPDTDTVVITISGFTATLSANIGDVLCNGGNTGTIDLVVSGPGAPFSYTWSTGAVTEDVSGLGAGTYTVTVTDAIGCTQSVSFNVGEPPVLVASGSVTSNYNGAQVSCNGSADGSAAGSGAGGNAILHLFVE